MLGINVGLNASAPPARQGFAGLRVVDRPNRFDLENSCLLVFSDERLRPVVCPLCRERQKGKPAARAGFP